MAARKQIQGAGSSALRLPVYKETCSTVALCGFSQEAHLGGLSLGSSHPAESDMGRERCAKSGNPGPSWINSGGHHKASSFEVLLP